MKTIAVYSLKGGTGKTITTATLGHMYATYCGGDKKSANRTLLIDADSQGNLSQYFKRYSEDESGMRYIVQKCGLDMTKDKAIGTDWPFLDIISGCADLYELDRYMYHNKQTNIVSQLCTQAQNTYELCLIDCAPAMNMLTINALCAADYLIVPIRIDAFSSNGLIELDTQLEGIRKINEKLQVTGIIITHYQNTPLINEAVQLLQSRFPIFRQKISYSKYIAESTLRQIPLAEMNMRIGPTVQYRKLLKELILKVSE